MGTHLSLISFEPPTLWLYKLLSCYSNDLRPRDSRGSAISFSLKHQLQPTEELLDSTYSVNTYVNLDLHFISACSEDTVSMYTQ